MDEKRAFGIDLGTTFSCIASVDEFGKPVVFKDSNTNQEVVPSAVLVEASDHMVVGQEAKDSADQIDRLVTFVKREMGNPSAQWEFDGVTYKPETISSAILKKLKENAGIALGISKEQIDEQVKDVVITCPAYFGTEERMATGAAGRIAGFNVLNIISEPTAAAIFYGSEAQADAAEKNVLVYDLGGGTFGVTFLYVKPGEIEEVCTDGNHQLGGKNWDETLRASLIDEFVTKNPDNDVEGDDENKYRLLLEAEKTKQQLTGREKAKARFKSDNVEVTRERFNALTLTLLDRTIELSRRVLEYAKSKGHPDLDEILLLGGSTRMPQVAERLEREFGKKPFVFESNEAIVKGAAIYADYLNRPIFD